MFFHFGQSLFAEYFVVLLGANEMGEHDMAVRHSGERGESERFQDDILSDSFSP